MMVASHMKMKPETVLLVDALRECWMASKMASYEHLNKVAGYDVMQYRSRLTTALEYLQREEQLLFKNIRFCGYMPLTDAQAVSIVGTGRKQQIRSTVRKWRNEYDTINVSALAERDMVSYVKQGIQLQCIEATTGQAIEATIEQAVAQEPSPANWFKSVDIKKLIFGD